MKIGIYARVSKTDGSQSPENQLTPLRDYAKALGGEIVEEYVDMASGGNGSRPGFLKMLDDADRRKFDLLLIWSLDRLSREGISNTLSYLERLKRNGVALKSLQESWLDTRDEGIGRLLLAILSWVAKMERERIIARTRARLDLYKEQIKNKGFAITKEGKRITKLGRPKGAKDKKRRRKSGYLLRYAGRASGYEKNNGDNRASVL